MDHGQPQGNVSSKISKKVLSELCINPHQTYNRWVEVQVIWKKKISVPFRNMQINEVIRTEGQILRAL